MLSRFRKTPISSPKAFECLYERSRLPVYRYIYGLTGGPQELVEDLVAETFIRAWKARQRFDGDADGAVGWLIRIARRLVIDDYRRSTVRAAHSLTADPVPMPEQSLLEAEQRRTLLNLLKGLPDEQRELLTLRYMLGWRVADIAVHLGLTENNVSVTIHRLLAKLREQWPDPETNLEKII